MWRVARLTWRQPKARNPRPRQEGEQEATQGGGQGPRVLGTYIARIRFGLRLIQLASPILPSAFSFAAIGRSPLAVVPCLLVAIAMAHCRSAVAGRIRFCQALARGDCPSQCRFIGQYDAEAGIPRPLLRLAWMMWPLQSISSAWCGRQYLCSRLLARPCCSL